MSNPLRAAALRRRSILGLDNTGSTGLNYDGGQYSRLTQDWIWAPIASADQEIRWDMFRLRARARELTRNNPWVARFIEMVGENVIGHEGMLLQSRVKRPGGDLDIGINDRVEDAFQSWSVPENASADGASSFVDLQWLALAALARDGEGLFRELPGFDNEYGYALQQVDADRMDHTYFVAPDAHRNEIRMSVEINAWGRPVTYWLWERHPYDLNGSAERGNRIPVPASEMIHLFMKRRPGQTRDVTWLAPVMLPLRMLGGYAEAELISARAAASTMGLLVPDPEAEEDPDSPASEGTMSFEVQPATITRMPAGFTDLKTFAAQHPNAQFDVFAKAMLRMIAGGLNVAYNGLANDLEGVNYSSIRAGLLSERDHWRRLQSWTKAHFHRRVYRGWLKWAITAGAVDLPGRNVSRWFDHDWQARGWDWVDPLKDITASAAELQLALNSRTRIAGERGRDLERVFHDRQEERALAERYGETLVDVIGTASVKEQASAKDQGGEIVPEPEDAATEDAATARLLLTLLAKRGNGSTPHDEVRR